MCKIDELCVLVVESEESELQRNCDSLKNLGIKRMICASNYEEAIEAISKNSDIDIVLADYDIEEGKHLGMLLVSVIKKEYPSILVVLTSSKYTCSIVLNSMLHSEITADDVLDKNREGDIEELMGKWITLAQAKIDTRELIYGKEKKPV